MKTLIKKTSRQLVGALFFTLIMMGVVSTPFMLYMLH